MFILNNFILSPSDMEFKSLNLRLLELVVQIQNDLADNDISNTWEWSIEDSNIRSLGWECS